MTLGGWIEIVMIIALLIAFMFALVVALVVPLRRHTGRVDKTGTTRDLGTQAKTPS
jgi:hypothetical protein